MSLSSLDVAYAKITEAHRRADRSRGGRHPRVEQRMARRARRTASSRRRLSRLSLFTPSLGSTWR